MTPFQDGFESGTFSKWSLVRNMSLQQQDVYSGAWATRALSTSNTTSYARATLSAPTNDLYLRIRFKVVSKGSGTVYILRFRSAADATLLGLYISGSGKLGIRNDVSGIATTSATAITTGVWHEVQVHGLIGPSGRTDVWLDGTLVSDLSKAQALGSTSVGIIQIGENSNGQAYDIPMDDVAADTSFITGAVPPTATPEPIDTATPIPTDTATAVPTSTNTPIPSNTAVSSATSIPPSPTDTVGPTGTATTAATATASATPAPTNTAVATDTPLAPTSTATATAVADSTPPPASASFGPVADSYTSQSKPTHNYGTGSSLWVDQGAGVTLQTFLRFSVTGVTQTVTNATLWVYASNGTNVGPTVATTGNGWAETGITWNTMPAPGSSQFPSASPIGTGTWISVNVTGVVTGNGDFSFTLIANSTDAAAFNSRENATNHPRLDLTFGSTPLPRQRRRRARLVGPSATPSPTPSVTPTPPDRDFRSRQQRRGYGCRGHRLWRTYFLWLV